MNLPPALAQIVKPLYRSRTELEYANHLFCLQKTDQILRFNFEPVTFKLGNDCRYTPDFMVVMLDRTIEFHEVKGRQREDSMVKLRVASSQFPIFRWFLVTRGKQSQWVLTEIGS